MLNLPRTPSLLKSLSSVVVLLAWSSALSIAIGLTPALFFACPRGHAETLSKLPLNVNLSLLKDRLTICMPQGARIEPRGHSIMSAAEADEDETRAVVQVGQTKLVLMAVDAHAECGKDFRNNVIRYYKQFEKEGKIEYRVLNESVSQPGLHYVQVVEEGGQNSHSEAQLVAMAIVASKDGSVQICSLYVGPEGQKDKTQLSALACQIFKTIGPGKGHIERSNRTIMLDSASGVSLKVPADIATSTQIGPDFDVIHCAKIKEFGAGEVELGIYVGGHPSFHPQNGAKKNSGSIFGRPITWYESVSGAQHKLEALVPVPDEQGTVLHLFIESPDCGGAEEMKKLAETIYIEKRKNAH